jgi:hypothetical protein
MKHGVIHSMKICLVATAAFSAAVGADRGAGNSSVGQGLLQLVITEAGSDGMKPVPARVHLKHADGQPVMPAGFPSWRDHFVCDGRLKIGLPWGEYRIEVERGPEYARWEGKFELNEASPEHSGSVPLARIGHMASEGWWSGDLHVHRSLNDAELLMRAEDLHIAQFTTWWNETNPWKSAPLPEELPVRFDGNRFYHPLAGEDERDGGALLYFNLERPLDITSAGRHHPASVVFAREAQSHRGAWIEIEKPFWWDYPMWLAHGLGDSIGVAQNHLHRGGVLDNEAWGRPRDRSRFPGPRGNGLYTQELYFHALNCGFWIPPSAGSASGVLPNPVGYNRVYVHLDGDLSWDRWWDGLRAGRAFVSNGPLLRAQANGQWPGHLFRSNGPLAIRFEARLDSRESIESVELIRNGRAEVISLPSLITFHESGWFLIRAIADAPHTLRFAMTAPWRVEIDGRPAPVQGRSARLFLDWTQERISALEQLDTLSAVQKSEVVEPWRRAESFWQEKVNQSAEPSRAK